MRLSITTLGLTRGGAGEPPIITATLAPAAYSYSDGDTVGGRRHGGGAPRLRHAGHDWELRLDGGHDFYGGVACRWNGPGE
jgi:hypothetical protein